MSDRTLYALVAKARLLLDKDLPLPVDLTTRLLGEGVDVQALIQQHNAA